MALEVHGSEGAVRSGGEGVPDPEGPEAIRGPVAGAGGVPEGRPAQQGAVGEGELRCGPHSEHLHTYYILAVAHTISQRLKHL